MLILGGTIHVSLINYLVISDVFFLSLWSRVDSFPLCVVANLLRLREQDTKRHDKTANQLSPSLNTSLSVTWWKLLHLATHEPHRLRWPVVSYVYSPEGWTLSDFLERAIQRSPWQGGCSVTVTIKDAGRANCLVCDTERLNGSMKICGLSVGRTWTACGKYRRPID